MPKKPRQEEQGVLLRPESPLIPTKSGMIKVEQIAHQECFVEPAFQENVSALGVLIAVVLTGSFEEGLSKYDIIEGRRRVKAALVGSVETIPFVYYENLQDGIAHVAALSIGYLRGENLYAEIQTLKSLQKLHAKDRQIAVALGIKEKYIEKRMKLTKLHPILAEGLLDNSVPPYVAKKACTFTDSEQGELVSILQESEKVTYLDLAAVRPSKPRKKSETSLPGFEYNAQQKAAAVLVGFLNDCRGSQGEHVSKIVGNLLNQVANFSESLADDGLPAIESQTIREHVMSFRMAFDLDTPEAPTGAFGEPLAPNRDPFESTIAHTFALGESEVQASISPKTKLLVSLSFRGPINEDCRVDETYAKAKIGDDPRAFLETRAKFHADNYAATMSR